MSTPSNNILSIPFRRSLQLSLSTTIRQYINTKYDQHPDMFQHDLEMIDVLRRDATNVREPHLSGIKKLQVYAGQLVWIGGKFPIDIGAEFTWYPALGYHTERPMARNNLKYELMNILYNLAALYSQLALNTPRGDTEGLKSAANYFSLAAGVLSHVQKSVLPELRMSNPPDDMDNNTLESLVQLFLAQSQECFWQKAVMDGYKDASIAKLAARVSDLYNLAADAAVSSEAISSAWIHHMNAKHHHFAAAAQYRAACDCLEKRKYGEEIARLKDAVICANDGIKEGRVASLNKTVLEDLQALKRKLEEDLKRAEKDNDLIFLNPVPPKAELKILERANMATARTPLQVANPLDYLSDHGELGPALFSKLVPFSVHVAISIYEERRDRMVNQNIIQELETLTEKIHTLLSTIGLPGSLMALEKPLGLPPSLIQHAEEIRQSDAINKIQRSLIDIDKLRSNDWAIYEEGKAALAAEKEEDDQLRKKYGTSRWLRPESQADPTGSKFWTAITEIGGYFQNSATSDDAVREKFVTNKELLEILSGSNQSLMNYVPTSTPIETSSDLKASVGRVRSVYNDILRMESKRRRKVETLREAVRRDDIKPDILKEAARLERTYTTTPLQTVHFEEFFEKRLDKLYEPEIEAIEKEAQDQENLLLLLQRSNREFESQKRLVDGKGHREREQVLQELNGAYFKYKEIGNNLEVGRKFYNDLNRIVANGFRDPVKAWVSERRIEARSLEEELNMPTLSNLNIQNNQQPIHNPSPGYISPPLAHNHQFAPQQQQPRFQQSYQQAYQQQQPPPHQQYQQPLQPQQQTTFPRPAVQSPAEASIQSWAGGAMQQPQMQPQPGQAQSSPMPGTWNPSMGIKFGGPPPAGGPQGQEGTWSANSGIRFG
ncbi:BRO1-like domain-containing protein [Trichoderma evansii]